MAKNGADRRKQAELHNTNRSGKQSSKNKRFLDRNCEHNVLLLKFNLSLKPCGAKVNFGLKVSNKRNKTNKEKWSLQIVQHVNEKFGLCFFNKLWTL